MANINQVVVEGNLTQAATLSRWNDNTPYCRFTVANNEYYKKPDGTYDSVTSFIDCQVKGNYAEAMAKHLLKGRRVIVSGRLKQNRWTDEHGQKHSAIVVKVSEISLAPFGTNNFKPSQTEEQAPEYSEDYNQGDYAATDMFDGNFPDEIPF